MRRVTVVAVAALIAGTGLHAQSGRPNPIIVTYAQPVQCQPRAVFGHDSQLSDGHESRAIIAAPCDIVFSDEADVLLPRLDPAANVTMTVTVRNMGKLPMWVRADQPDVIDAILWRYSSPVTDPWFVAQTPILCCSNGAMMLWPYESVVLVGMPGTLQASWFISSAKW